VTVEVRLAGPLRPYADGAAVARVEVPPEAAPTIRELLERLERRHPGLVGRVRDERGVVRRHVNVFVGADHMRELGGLEATLDGRQPVSILPAVSGGATGRRGPRRSIRTVRVGHLAVAPSATWPITDGFGGEHPAPAVIELPQPHCGDEGADAARLGDNQRLALG
jgi:sulfur-carrier protein